MNFPKWFLPIRNGFIVMILLLSQELLQHGIRVGVEEGIYSLAVALIYTMYEYTRLYKIDLSNLPKTKAKRGATTLLLPYI